MAVGKPQTFTVTEEHIKLLNRMYVGWDGCEYGAPAIDCKRPYGNSDVVGDIHEILTGEDRYDERDYDRLNAELDERYSVLHKEMQTVLQILVRNPMGLEPGGTYQTSDAYGVDWAWVS